MDISKDELLRINEGFQGVLRNSSSIEFALDIQKNSKLGKYKKLAYLIRAIIVDYPFSDGNKRTAMYLTLKFAEENKLQVERELLLHHLLSIAKNNIQDIRNIADRMKNAIR